MNILTIITENETHWLNMDDKTHRQVLFYRLSELAQEIMIRKNCLPLFYESNTLALLQKEQDSLSQQLQDYKQQQLMKECEFCNQVLSEQHKQIHQDYHVQQQLLQIQKNRVEEDIISLAEYFVHKNGAYSKSSQAAIESVQDAIKKQENYVMKLYQKLLVPQPQENIILPKKRILYDSEDNTVCLTCGEVLHVSIDHSQDDDFAYSMEAECQVLSNEKRIIYCAKNCATLGILKK